MNNYSLFFHFQFLGVTWLLGNKLQRAAETGDGKRREEQSRDREDA